MTEKPQIEQKRSLKKTIQKEPPNPGNTYGLEWARISCYCCLLGVRNARRAGLLTWQQCGCCVGPCAAPSPVHVPGSGWALRARGDPPDKLGAFRGDTLLPSPLGDPVPGAVLSFSVSVKRSESCLLFPLTIIDILGMSCVFSKPSKHCCSPKHFLLAPILSLSPPGLMVRAKSRTCGCNDVSLCSHVSVLLPVFPLPGRDMSCSRVPPVGFPVPVCWALMPLLLSVQLEKGHPSPLLFLCFGNVSSERATNFTSTGGGHPGNLLLKYTDTQLISQSCWKKFVLEMLEPFPWARIMSSILYKNWLL